MSGLTGWQQVALGLGAVSVSGVVALIGQWISRKSAKEIVDRADQERLAVDRRWRDDLAALQDRWQGDRQDVERRRQEDDRLLTQRWSRERTLELLDKALTRALASEERVQVVGLAQLQALSKSSLLQQEDEDLIDRVLEAVAAGRSAGSDAIEEAERDDAEVVVDNDERSEGSAGRAGA